MNQLKPFACYELVGILSFIYQLVSAALNANDVITVQLNNTRNFNQRNESHPFARLDNIILCEHLRYTSKIANSLT